MDKKRILVVEDEIELVKAMLIRLQQAGYEILSAYDGQEAWKRRKKKNPILLSLILCFLRWTGTKSAGCLKPMPDIAAYL